MSNEKYIVVLEPEGDFPEVLYDIETGLTCFFGNELEAFKAGNEGGCSFQVVLVWKP